VNRSPGRGAFEALEHRNFRLLWVGQLVSTAGSMMQNAAVLWQVSLLVDERSRPLALGLVGLFKFLAILVCALFSGVVADAFDRRRLMLVTTSLLTVLASLLALVTFLGIEHPWPIYLLTALSSAVGTFDGSARQALVPGLVPRLALPSAIALNTILFQAASSAGPALSGHVMARFGLGWVYVANAISFLAVLGALLAMRGVEPVAAGERSRVSLQSAVEGLRYVFRAPLIRSSMWLDFLATFFSSATALLPIFATDILHLGEEGYGYLVAAPAVGALLTSAILAPIAPRIVRRGKVLLWSVALYGAATALFGLSESFWLTYLCLALTGAADTVSIVLRNIIRQIATPDHLRGRMISVNMIFFLGGPQLGELEAGLVAQRFGAVFSVVSGGVLCLLSTAMVAWREPRLRAYRREETSESGSAASE
jgi:MFS family permease